MTARDLAQPPDEKILSAKDFQVYITFEDYNRFVQSWTRRTGRRIDFPRKLKPRLVALHYILMRFNRATTYAENEVNTIILKANPFKIDHVQVRRYLVDYGMLGRKGDGSQYRVARTYLALVHWDPLIPGTSLSETSTVAQFMEA